MKWNLHLEDHLRYMFFFLSFSCREATNALSVIWMKWVELSQRSSSSSSSSNTDQAAGAAAGMILQHSHLRWRRRVMELTVNPVLQQLSGLIVFLNHLKELCSMHHWWMWWAVCSLLQPPKWPQPSSAGCVCTPTSDLGPIKLLQYITV